MGPLPGAPFAFDRPVSTIKYSPTRLHPDRLIRRQSNVSSATLVAGPPSVVADAAVALSTRESLIAARGPTVVLGRILTWLAADLGRVVAETHAFRRRGELPYLPGTIPSQADDLTVGAVVDEEAGGFEITRG